MLQLQPKHVSQLVTLVPLVLCAVLLGRASAHFAGAMLMKPAASDAAASDAAQWMPTNLGRENATNIILKRNIFASALGDLTAVPSEENSSYVQAPWQLGGDAPLCSAGSLRLVGTLVNPSDPSWSLALVNTGSDQTKLMRAGVAVDSNEVLEVRAQEAIVRPSGGSACKLAMFTSQTAVPPSPGTLPITAIPPLVAPDANAASGFSREELDASIQKISDTQYNIKRELIDKALANQGGLLRSARMMPHEENGKVVGVKLYGLRRSSLFSEIGIRNGDLMKSINGLDMTSPDSALEAYSKLRNSNQVSISVVRQGSPVTLQYNIQ